MSFAVYGIAILVLVLSVMGGLAKCTYDIKSAQKAEDQAAITAAQTNTATCKSANVSLQESIKPIAAERDKQNAKVQELDGLWHDAAELALGWRAKYYGVQEKLSTSKTDAHVKGLRPADPKQTCEQANAEMDADAKVWLPEREARMREVLGLPAKPDALKVGK